jgi:predicted MPP superfamily phosphohydrolase
MSRLAFLIAMTGDYIHKGYRHVDEVAKALGKWKAPMGVFAVLGNHDFSVRNASGWRRHRGLHKAVADALESHGVRVLRNESAIVQRAGAMLQLAGIDDLWSGECDPDAATRVMRKVAASGVGP